MRYTLSIQALQVAVLSTAISEVAQQVFSMFTDWTAEGDVLSIAPVLSQFEAYCQPRKNVPLILSGTDSVAAYTNSMISTEQH